MDELLKNKIIEAPAMSDSDSDSDSDNESVKSETSAVDVKGVFPKLIAEYMKIDDELSEIRAVVREKNKKKKNLSDQLIQFYKKKEVDHVTLKSGAQLNMNQKKTTQGLKKELIESLLTDFLKDSEKAKKATEYIYENRQVKFSPVLKRQNN